MTHSNLVMKYKLLDKDAALFAFQLNSSRDFEKTIFLPSDSNKKAMKEKLSTLNNQAKSLEVPDNVFLIINQHIKDFLFAQDNFLESFFSRPWRHINLFLYTFHNLVRNDSRPDEEKKDLLLERFSQGPELWVHVSSWLPRVSQTYLLEAVAACELYIKTMNTEIKKIEIYFPKLSSSGQNAMKQSIQDMQTRMNTWISELQQALLSAEPGGIKAPSDDDIIVFEESYYRSVLEDELGVSLDAILSWHEAEIEKTREDVFKIMSTIKISDPMPTNMIEINNILLKYAGPANSPEEIFTRGRSYLKRTSKAAKDYVWLPEESCALLTVPEHLKESYPWGGYGGGCTKRRPIQGNMFLNNYNYKAVTDGWIKMNTVHEAYPGHHVQYVRAITDKTPELVKLGAKQIPITEGTCHRSEKLFEFVFEEDPFYPLFVAYRRHHTAVRIKADLSLRYFGKPIKEAVNLYMNELGFDYHIARGQVQAQEFMQGYFTTYYYGMKTIANWEKEYQYDEKEFTEHLFSAGRISMENLKLYLDLSPEDKQRYLNDFSSLLLYPEK